MRIVLSLFALLLLAGCKLQQGQDEERVLSQTYMHKYGYPISKEDWEANAYPGEVITRYSSGVTMTAEYLDGKLHGTVTYTFPHSYDVERICIYDEGVLLKDTRNNTSGKPIYEKEFLSSDHYTVRTWYEQGTPRIKEEYDGKKLREGKYFTLQNEIEAQVSKGQGTRIQRNERGLLIGKDTIRDGYTVFRETFYPNGAVESRTMFHDGKVHGSRMVYGHDGEPVLIEEWVDGNLHGLATYYKHGVKYREVTYCDGKKEGIERTFVDGHILTQEITWSSDQRHGLTTIYVDGKPEIEQWYYCNKPVKKKRFDELVQFDMQIREGHRLLE